MARGRVFSLPQLFVGGRLLSGADEVRQLHKADKLLRLLEGTAGQALASACGTCGGVHFVPCHACAGFRKVFVEEEGRTSRCSDCNENGLAESSRPALLAASPAQPPELLEGSGRAVDKEELGRAPAANGPKSLIPKFPISSRARTGRELPASATRGLAGVASRTVGGQRTGIG